MPGPPSVCRSLAESDDAFRRDVKEGFDQLERGEYVELDDERLRALGEEIKRRGWQRYEAAKKGA